MNIQPLTLSDIPAWRTLSREYDQYVLALVPDLTEWYANNDTELSFEKYMQAKITQQEVFMLVDADTCAGVIAFSRRHNRITFLAITHNFNVQQAGNALLNAALTRLDLSRPVSINEIQSPAPQIQQIRLLLVKHGFIKTTKTLEHGVPVDVFTRNPT